MLPASQFIRTNTIICRFCAAVFHDEALANQHVCGNQRLPLKAPVKCSIYTCKVSFCKFIGTNAEDLLRHVIRTHFPTISCYKVCPDCDLMYLRDHAIYQHVRDKHGYCIDLDDVEEEIEIQCRICPSYKCSNKNTFAKHMRKQHPSAPLSCPYVPCQFNTHQFWEFFNHLMDHLIKETTYNRCPGCDKTFENYNPMVQHYKDKQANGDPEHSDDFVDYSTSDDSYCSLCNFEYEFDDEDEPEAFNEHLKVHNLQFPEGIDMF